MYKTTKDRCVPHWCLLRLLFSPVCSSKDHAFPLSTQTALHLAVITNQANVCLNLLASGCDPTLVDDHGDTPLHIACRHGNLLCFSVITQNCQPEHLCRMMAACNYHGETLVLNAANAASQEEGGGLTCRHGECRFWLN